MGAYQSQLSALPKSFFAHEAVFVRLHGPLAIRRGRLGLHLGCGRHQAKYKNMSWLRTKIPYHSGNDGIVETRDTYDLSLWNEKGGFEKKFVCHDTPF